MRQRSLGPACVIGVSPAYKELGAVSARGQARRGHGRPPPVRTRHGGRPHLRCHRRPPAPKPESSPLTAVSSRTGGGGGSRRGPGPTPRAQIRGSGTSRGAHTPVPRGRKRDRRARGPSRFLQPLPGEVRLEDAHLPLSLPPDRTPEESPRALEALTSAETHFLPQGHKPPLHVTQLNTRSTACLPLRLLPQGLDGALPVPREGTLPLHGLSSVRAETSPTWSPQGSRPRGENEPTSRPFPPQRPLAPPTPRVSARARPRQNPPPPRTQAPQAGRLWWPLRHPPPGTTRRPVRRRLLQANPLHLRFYSKT